MSEIYIHIYNSYICINDGCALKVASYYMNIKSRDRCGILAHAYICIGVIVIIAYDCTVVQCTMRV